jgi:alpha-glucosidase (family GH31 glycosyl hydrolase)
VDGFKTDGGEHLWGDDLRFGDGRRGAEISNLFPNLYQTTYAELAGPSRVLFSRAGFTGTQTVSCHWAGDENSTFEAFRHSIIAGLTAGVSGIAFWGWDVAGFSGEIPSAELYLRAAAMAAFCPIMQYHSEFNEHRKPNRDRTPWNIQECTGDADVIPIFRFYANLRMNLLPYIWSEAIKASRSGLPLMRALPLEFPDDAKVFQFPYQYLFGESLLVAPVAWEGRSSVEVYLPRGRWYDFWSGKRHTGPAMLRYPTPKDIIPVFVREGSVIALNLDDSLALGSSVRNSVDTYRRLHFRVYPAEQAARFEWFEDPSRPPACFDIRPYDESFTAQH